MYTYTHDPFLKFYGLIFIKEIYNSLLSKPFKTRHICCKKQNVSNYLIIFISGSTK